MKKQGVQRETKESEVQKLILDYLRLNKCLAFKVYNGGVYIKKTDKYIKSPIKGVSDIIGCTRSGRIIAVEVKKRGKTPCKDGKPSKEQLDFISEVNKRGGIGLIAYGLDDVKNLKLK